jgi:hypothetical protein
MGGTWTALAIVCVLADGTAPAPVEPLQRVRGVDEHARRIIGSALQRSPTVRDLASRLDGTDVIAYVRVSMAATETASTTLLDVTGSVRYLMISVNPLRTPDEMLELLGHELQHAVEIASAPEVRSERALIDLYRRIGLSGTARNRFETVAAQGVARQVRREVAAGPVTALARKNER